MRPYIQNLTDNLIGKNRYDDMLRRMRYRDIALDYVKCDLLSHDVNDMRPETLGKIMCSFDIGDVMATKEELFQRIHFSGDCEDMLRELVALCLAYAILDRLDPMAITRILPYRRVPRKMAAK